MRFLFSLRRKTFTGVLPTITAKFPKIARHFSPDRSALEWSKLIAERYVEYYANTKNFRSCIFRLSTVYAPNSPNNTPNFVTHYADAINMGERISLPANGLPKRDLLAVEDFS